MSLRALAWLVVPLVGLAELGAGLYQEGRAPDLHEWREARAALARLRKEGDLVVIAPRWAEPNARHAFGDALMPLRDVARADESSYRRVVEVSVLGSHASELAAHRVLSETREGKLSFRVLENPSAATVAYDFVDHVPDAAVAVLTSDGERPCPWNAAAVREAGGLHGPPAYPGARHQCAGASWHFVGTTVIEDETWRPRRCLWAQPPATGTVVIRFPAVPLGKVVRGHGAFPFWDEREKKGAPIELEVLAAGESLGRFTHAAGEGWKAFEFPAGEHAGKPTDVEFRVKSTRSQSRQFCFQADTR